MTKKKTRSHQKAPLSLTGILNPKSHNDQIERQLEFQNLLKDVLPQLNNNVEKIIMTQVMLTLKLEGIIDNNITPEQSKMIQIIKESILNSPEKKQQALQFSQNLLETG